ncbi:hypothetical protein CTEN210_08855 [Chaetoceros tenuissimus]|uniref:G-protein coupled receptors family 1 profile domain-containing protein n=1 Tax=Chaetoceros tenuissimus TaxID=426638 RepID=A0AAD3CXF4_9STRA|nr:hypothetical protein CTEN210_08855 [Chaetoceros tenuissimus]
MRLSTLARKTEEQGPRLSCVDTPGWVDTYGDGCDWYLKNGCEEYAYYYGADIHCCICKGFDVSSAPSISSAPSMSFKPSSAPSVSPAPSILCVDTPGWVNTYGVGCDWYLKNGCEYAYYDGADIHCCICKGLSSPEVMKEYWERPKVMKTTSSPSQKKSEPEVMITFSPSPIKSQAPAEQTEVTSVKIDFPPKQSIMIWSILQTISSCLSLIATVAIIVMIARSYAKLTSPFHRLLLGLCIADILSSIGYMLSTIPVPSNYSEDIWNASGNTATCTAQGFILFLGLYASQLYNCSLCMYYLIIIKYNKKDAYIQKFVEPWLHAVPILISLIGGITIAAKTAFNAGYTNCSIGDDPPGCASSDLLECKRGRDAKTLFLVFATIPYITVPCVIALTMGIMYYTARQNEKKMKGYGIHTLRLNTATTVSSNNNDEAESSNEKFSLSQNLRNFFRLSSSASSQSSSSSRSRKLNKQSKAVLQKALAYSLAYLATFICPFIISIINLADEEASFGLSLTSRILFPLQGCFNFFVFIFPRIQSAKRGNADLSWSRAFVYALKSRGSRPKGVARRKN